MDDRHDRLGDLRQRVEAIERREREEADDRHKRWEAIAVRLAEGKRDIADLSGRMARIEKGALGVLLAIAAAAGSALLSLIGWSK